MDSTKPIKNNYLKSVHFKKPVTRSSFLSKSVVIFNITTTNMTTLFERNEDRVTGFLKWTDFNEKFDFFHPKIQTILSRTFTALLIQDSSMFSSINQNLTTNCLFVLPVWLYLFWTKNCSCYDLKNNFWFTTGKTQKSTNNWLSDFGLIKVDMDLSFSWDFVAYHSTDFI